MTRWARYTSGNESVASVDPQGLASVTGHGEAAIKAWYMSWNVVATISSAYPTALPADTFAKATTYAESRLAIVTAEPELVAGVTEGDDEAGYHWRVTIDDIPDPVPPENPTAVSNLRVEMKQITAVVQHGGREVMLTTIRVMPKKLEQR